MFLFLWQFLIPLVICVYAYCKILVVIRRQSNVMPTSRRHVAVKPAAGPSTEPAPGPSSEKNERENGVNEGTARTKGASQSNATGFSKAKINVIRTMIFISVSFVACYMPYDTYFFVRSWTVYLCILLLLFIK